MTFPSTSNTPSFDVWSVAWPSHAIDQLEAYACFLEQSPSEGEALFRDLLIGVTSFFRDTEGLRRASTTGDPRSFAIKPGRRVEFAPGCPGCSTGEEAYSIAILLQERVGGASQEEL